MANEKKYLDAEGLAKYDALLKEYIGNEVSTAISTIQYIPEPDILTMFAAINPPQTQEPNEE